MKMFYRNNYILYLLSNGLIKKETKKTKQKQTNKPKRNKKEKGELVKQEILVARVCVFILFHREGFFRLQDV